MSDDRAVAGVADAAEEVLRRRAEALARKPDAEATDDREALLVFRVGQSWYAVRTGEVREIAQDPVVAAVPCVPEFIRGVTSVRGEIVSVTDAASLIGIAVEGRPPARVALVLENAECVTALGVDEVGGIVEVRSASLEPPLPTTTKALAEFVSATVFLEEGLVSVLSVGRILQPVTVTAP
ncbi:MAG TPA: chemotaxis protein CheW [Coriobacteriia bacterium]|nr:chemotaxis protein CheW [Coriobacteriia bacterium]